MTGEGGQICENRPTIPYNRVIRPYMITPKKFIINAFITLKEQMGSKKERVGFSI